MFVALRLTNRPIKTFSPSSRIYTYHEQEREREREKAQKATPGGVITESRDPFVHPPRHVTKGEKEKRKGDGKLYCITISVSYIFYCISIEYKLSIAFATASVAQN